MATEIRLRKTPHGQQQKFIDCAAPEQLYGGAKRGGKSVALCMKIIMLSVLFPGNRILLARKDFTDLQDTTLNEFWQVCPPELLDATYGTNGHHKGERCIRLRTINPVLSSEILYRGLGGPEDVEKAKGLNLGALAIDEPSELDFDTFKMLRAQLTWRLPDGRRPPYMVMLASNPEPGWVKRRFIDERQDGCVFIPALPRDNPYLPEGWEDELRASYDSEWVEKYLDGSWEVTEGSVFPELDAKIHAVPAFDTTGFALQASIDHATTGTTCMVITCTSHNGDLIAVDEYYEKDKTVAYHAGKMVDMMAQYTPRVSPPQVQQKFAYTLIDPSCCQRTQQGGNQLQSVGDLYRENGINCVPAWNALEAGLQRLKQMLHVDPRHLHPFLDGQLGAPRLYIVRKRCPNLWREMKDLKKEVLPAGKIRFVGSDHAVDNLRYIANSRPKPAQLGEKDFSRLPIQDRFAIAAHDKWANKFGRSQGDTGSYF